MSGSALRHSDLGSIDLRCICVWLSFCLFSCPLSLHSPLLFSISKWTLSFCSFWILSVCTWVHLGLRSWWGLMNWEGCLIFWWQRVWMVFFDWGLDSSWRWHCGANHFYFWQIVWFAWRCVNGFYERRRCWFWDPLLFCFLKRYLKYASRYNIPPIIFYIWRLNILNIKSLFLTEVLMLRRLIVFFCGCFDFTYSLFLMIFFFFVSKAFSREVSLFMIFLSCLDFGLWGPFRCERW